ncbi:MAG: hypothetical protein P0S96_03895 [Simkaniaceae bacterium]|nr:hypothetical protein [Candidatus Sacchlamyda saccharinae]
MVVWLFSLILLSHPLNFLTTSDQGQLESVDEEEEEIDVIVIPIPDRNEEILTES